MKKLFALLLVGALLLTGISGALAQGPSGIVWSSAYQIQNLETTVATVQIAYYAQGSTSIYTGQVTVPGSGSVTIFPFVLNDNVSGGPGTFNGSAVLSSDKAIAAILNTQTGAGSSSFYGASTQGFSSGATAINLPLIACNNGGFDTWFNIQNVGTGDATVTVTYVPGLFGTPGVTDQVTIPSMRAKTFDQRVGSTTGTKTCTQLADGSTKFVGGATISSNQPVVATVMFLGTGSMKAVQGYNGFTAGSTAINLPLIMANNSGYYTSIQVQNTGTGPAQVVVDYGVGTYGNTTDPGQETFSLAQGASKTIIHAGNAFSQVNWGTFGTYVGGATITQNGTTQPLVAVVNQNRIGQPLGSTYEGMSPLNATNAINLPLVAANNSGFNTGMQIQATQDGTSVTLTYSENSQQAGEIPVADTFTLNAGQSKTLIQMGAPGALAGVNNWNTIGKYVGSAVVSANKPILAIVNFNGPATGDTFYTYEGFNR